MSYPAMSTLGSVTTPTRAKCADVLAALEAATGKTLKTVWGKGAGEHATGRALDFMVFGDRAAGDWIASYLWENRARLDVQHIIWRQRIISTRVAPGVWRAMADRGSPTQNHMDHPHVLFASDTYRPPSTPKGPPMAEPLTPAEQRAMFERIMRGSDRTNPDGSAARLLDSADGDYLRQQLEALTPPGSPA
ncbi:MAG TPA: hypothetical protein PKA99_13655 [Dermatophilaceae bacterium]|nr:hypothetical protein [Dermatophilaceae bacterium]